MKSILAFMLCALLAFSVVTGCTGETQTQNTAETSAAQSTDVQKSTNKENSAGTSSMPFLDTSVYDKAYLDIINEYEEKYGTNPEITSGDFSAGLYCADLVDFDNNNIPELIVAYADEKDFKPSYSIYAIIDDNAQCVDTGKLFLSGGVNPSVNVYYTEDIAYFVTGASQSYLQEEYHSFDGKKFEIAFSHSKTTPNDNDDTVYRINEKIVTKEEYYTATEAFNKKISGSTVFLLEEDPAATKAQLQSIKKSLE